MSRYSINTLLLRAQNKWQLLTAVGGTLLGVTLLLFSLQTWLDYRSILRGDSEQGEYYVLLQKPVTIFNTLGIKNYFTERDLDTLRAQPYIAEVSPFVSNDFGVQLVSQQLGFRTELFFEAVADEFVDVDGNTFSWQVGQKEVPIVLSRDYLALYNFGFAPSQGLPPFTPGTISRVEFSLVIRGNNGRRRTLDGRIVGFSDRINSILVPMEFMQWANQTFGERGKTIGGPSRVLARLANPYAPEMEDFLLDAGFVVNKGQGLSSQLAALLQRIVSLTALIGFVIFVLSGFVFVLNYQLLISRASGDIRRLLQIGYPQRQVSQLLLRNMAIIFGVTATVALLLLLLTRSFAIDWFLRQGFALSGNLHWGVWLAWVLLIAGFVLINRWVIQREVKALG